MTRSNAGPQLGAAWRPPMALVLSLLAANCAPEPRAGLDPGNPTVAIVITPATVTINTGDTAHFQSYARLATGDSASVPINWIATGGSLGPNGEFTAVSPGLYDVIGIAQNGSASDTAAVTVVGPQSNLVAIDVSPDGLGVQPNTSALFTVSGILSDGSTTPVAVTWSSTGGTIDAGGNYFAGPTLGTYFIIASTASGLVDTTLVFITPNAPVLEQVLVSPATVSLQGGATQQFTAVGNYDDGTTGGVSVTWRTTGGTISPTGFFSGNGLAAGNYFVIATAQNGLADSGVVTVTLPFVTSISLTPAAVSLTTGARQQFTTIGRLNDGSFATVSVGYTPTGGTVTNGGLYTAGQTAGNFRLIAKTTTGNLADTSSITLSKQAVNLTGILLSPAPTVQMLAGGSLQFTAVGKFSDGSTAPSPVTFTATAGTISTAGLYVAGQVQGTYTIIARGTTGNFADTALVTVNPRSSLQRITISPSSTGIPLGGQKQFTTIGALNSGGPVEVNVTYTATGGSITSGGLYTGGHTAGNYTVTATESGGLFTAVATVNLGAGSCLNEPSGLSVITDQPWDAVPPSTGTDQYGWEVTAGKGNLTILPDPAAPLSPPNIMQARIPAGHPGGTGPFHIERSFVPVTSQTGVSTLYICFWLKVASGFTNNGNTGTKLAFAYPPWRGTANHSEFYISLFGNATDVGYMAVNITSPTSGLNRNMQTRFKWPQHFDEWHQFEVLTTANSQGNADGTVTFWVDGAVDFQFSNVKYFVDQVSGGNWNFVDISPTYGGGPNPAPYNMYMYFDNWFMSGK